MTFGNRSLFAVSLLLSVSPAVAGDFDGNQPLVCVASQVNDCLPGAPCKQTTTAEAGFADQIAVDFDKKQASGPYRKEPLPIDNLNQSEEQVILQGTNLSFAWSAVIFKKDGRMTATIADREGAFVFFGQCAPQ